MFVEKISFLAILILGVHSSYDCMQFALAEFGLRPSGGQCGVFNEEANITLIDTSVCTGGTVCRNNQTLYLSGEVNMMFYYPEDIYCHTPLSDLEDYSDGLPGTRCKSNGDCLSKNCTNGLCKGYGKGENFNCDYENDTYFTHCSGLCSPGLFAKSKYPVSTCVEQYKGNHSCDYTYQCENDHVCANGNCTKMFSVKNGQKIDFDFGYYDPSLGCENFYYDFYTSKCAEPTKSKNGQAAKCRKDEDCITTDGNHTNCECGLSGEKHCTLARGDDYFVELRKLLKEWVSSGKVNNCNTLARFDPVCVAMNMDKDFSDRYYEYLTLAYYYAYIKDADDEVIKVYAPRYYSISNSGLVTVAYALIFFLLA